ncbi:adiponectin receptor [Strigomonas culicis]|uniref:Adiponectin receptor n=1 Tax=Strigomonas culicis TaxID=28005 RepID=S9VBA0_9TRYP|nr:adiponectin receptor [Strigomonas culicis]|eukprot:EPY24306.1 adiponectin receptor [Strigomonas culicis]
MRTARRSSTKTQTPTKDAEQGASHVVEAEEAMVYPEAPSAAPRELPLLQWVHRHQLRLVDITEVPPYLQFNPYIKKYYRPCPISLSASVTSLFFNFHNESINIWMHLFCFGLMLYFCVFPPVPYLVREVSPRLHPTDRNGVEQSTLSLHRPETLFRFLSLCLACTFALSVAYHVGMNCCHSARSYAVLLQCDVAGILFSITGSVAVYFYKGNACFMTSPPDAGHAHQQLVYQVLFYAMGVASLLTAYVLCFQSKRAPLAGAAGGGLTSLQRRVPAVFVLCHLVDYGFLSLGALWEHLRGVPLAPPHPQKSDNVLLRQIFRSRRRVQVAAEALDGTREPQPTVPSAVPMSTSRRAVILCGYSALHLLTYLVIIYPKV